LRVKRFMPLAAFAMLALLLFKGLSIDPTALPAARLGQPFPDFSQPELLTEEVIGASALQPQARQWLSELGDPYRLNIADRDGTVGLDLGVYGAPETYVLGPDGVILHRHVGVLDEAVFDRDIRRYFTASSRVAQASALESIE